MASDAALAQSLEEERQLIELAKDGNLDAMRPIFEKYANPLYSSVILPRLGDAATGEDVLRDTFHTAIEKLDKFRWTGRSIYAWLRTIAINKVYDVHRKSKRSMLLVEKISHEAATDPEPDARADTMLISAQERTINRDRIDETLAAISPRYRLAIELRLIEELPRDECAEKMAVTTSTFDVVLYRAVRAFRKRFGARDSE